MRAPRWTAGPRGRAWLTALLAALLVALYLVGEFTYARSHLPPNRYDPQPPGAVVRLDDATFQVTSLRQTEAWGQDSDGPAAPEPGATWIVAEVAVTPTVKKDFLGVELTLVGTDGSVWEPETLGPSHAGESYLPDDYAVGTTYPIVSAYQVPLADAARLAGLARSQYDGRAWPLIRPAA